LDLGFDLGGTNRTPEFFADRARLTDQCTWFKTKTLVGCTPKGRKNFAVQAAVVLFGSFFSSRRKSCGIAGLDLTALSRQV
jgi:hypothetical protein